MYNHCGDLLKPLVCNQARAMTALRPSDGPQHDIYASVGTAIKQIDPTTGDVTQVVTGLNGAHGLLFLPSSSPQESSPSASLGQDFQAELQKILASGAEPPALLGPAAAPPGDTSVASSGSTTLTAAPQDLAAIVAALHHAPG
jgi:hypothetical protein